MHDTPIMKMVKPANELPEKSHIPRSARFLSGQSEEFFHPVSPEGWDFKTLEWGFGDLRTWNDTQGIPSLLTVSLISCLPVMPVCFFGYLLAFRASPVKGQSELPKP